MALQIDASQHAVVLHQCTGHAPVGLVVEHPAILATALTIGFSLRVVLLLLLRLLVIVVGCGALDFARQPLVDELGRAPTLLTTLLSPIPAQERQAREWAERAKEEAAKLKGLTGR